MKSRNDFFKYAFCLLIIIIGSISFPTFCITIYVPDDYGTIQGAVDAADPEDTVHVRSGFYRITQTIYVNRNITLEGEGADITVIEATSPLSESGDILFVTNNFGTTTTIKGFHIKNAGDNGIMAGNGLYGNINVSRNLIINCGSGGIYLNDATGAYGVAEIINNTIIYCGSGLGTNDWKTITMYNNIIVWCDYGVYRYNVDYWYWEYNDVFGNSEADWYLRYHGPIDPPPNNISADPLFVNSYGQSGSDFFMTADSPCIDAGHPDEQYNDPDGSRNDIGVFPFDHCPPNPQLSRWNVDDWVCCDENGNFYSIQLENNCYNYATNRITNTKAQPGRSKGNGIWWGFNFCDHDRTPPDPIDYDYMSNLLTYFASLDHVSLITDDPEVNPDTLELPEGYCLMAGVVGCIPFFDLDVWSFVADYHWFRRNNDGTWSHKPGLTEARDTDDLGAQIDNPADLANNISEPNMDMDSDGIIEEGEYFDINNNGEFDPGRTYYEHFCGWYMYKDANVDQGGPDVRLGGRIPFGLIHIAPGTLRIIGTGTSGLQYGWHFTDSAEIDALVTQYLTGLVSIDEPEWPSSSGYHGFILEAEAGVMSSDSGLWTDTDEVRIVVWSGFIEITTYPGYGDEVMVAWYSDLLGLEEFLLMNVATRIQLLEAGVRKPGTPEGPSWGGVSIPYTFTGYTTDPELDEIYYQFDWGDGDQSDWLGPFESGDTCTASHTWREFGSYYVKVRAKDSWDFISDWSDELSVNIGNIICNYLGDSDRGVDNDFYVFMGSKSEEVTINLFKDESEESGRCEERASLIVWKPSFGNWHCWVFKIDRSSLPNQIQLILPCDGKYFVLAREQLRWMPGDPFTGNYCVSLHSSGDAAFSFQEWEW